MAVHEMKVKLFQPDSLARPQPGQHGFDECIFLYYISIMEKADFEWDDQKDIENRLKHGVSFHEAQYAFADPHRIIVEDLQHGEDEERFFCIGRIDTGIMTVRFTMRGPTIRIIGAGYWRKGKKLYEQKNTLH